MRMFGRRQKQLDDCVVWIPRWTLASMFEAAEAKAPLETGGMLLGYMASDGAAIVVTDTVGAGPEATHKRHGFEPDSAWQQGLLSRVYHRSGRTTTYLGDWHSHPRGSPVPSREDTRTARRVARYEGSRTKNPLTMILGADSEQKDTALCYRYRGRKLRPVELRLMDA
jgi:integrative and conjugative element protein (TIGR02256 family)